MVWLSLAPLFIPGETVDGFFTVDKADSLIEKQALTTFLDIKTSGGESLSEDFVFDYEIFVNNILIRQVFNFSVTEINELLHALTKKTEPSDFLQVILINSGHRFFSIQRNNEIFQSNSGEIILDLYPGDKTPYNLEIIPRKNLIFFYVENTDGIRNIRSIIGHIEEITTSGNDFMIFYNGPGEPMIINNQRQLTTFFNTLFTSTTQPPFPSEELKRVKESLERFIPFDATNLNLEMFFYIGQLSYNHLKRRFVVSLVNEIAADYSDMTYSVGIYTDFDVREREKGFLYVNIAKP